VDPNPGFLFLQILVNTTTILTSTEWHLSCHQHFTVRALKETQSTNPKQWPGTILFLSTNSQREWWKGHCAGYAFWIFDLIVFLVILYAKALYISAAVVLCNAVHRVKRSCFNCGGDHDLIACNERRDVQRIGENRRQFQLSRVAQGKQQQTRCSVLLCHWQQQNTSKNKKETTDRNRSTKGCKTVYSNGD